MEMLITANHFEGTIKNTSNHSSYDVNITHSHIFLTNERKTNQCSSKQCAKMKPLLRIHTINKNQECFNESFFAGYKVAMNVVISPMNITADKIICSQVIPKQNSNTSNYRKVILQGENCGEMERFVKKMKISQRIFCKIIICYKFIIVFWTSNFYVQCLAILTSVNFMTIISISPTDIIWSIWNNHILSKKTQYSSNIIAVMTHIFCIYNNFFLKFVNYGSTIIFTILNNFICLCTKILNTFLNNFNPLRSSPNFKHMCKKINKMFIKVNNKFHMFIRQIFGYSDCRAMNLAFTGFSGNNKKLKNNKILLDNKNQARISVSRIVKNPLHSVSNASDYDKSDKITGQTKMLLNGSRMVLTERLNSSTVYGFFNVLFPSKSNLKKEAVNFESFFTQFYV